VQLAHRRTLGDAQHRTEYVVPLLLHQSEEGDDIEERRIRRRARYASSCQAMTGLEFVLDVGYQPYEEIERLADAFVVGDGHGLVLLLPGMVRCLW
jgi:hypothetical protein